MGRRRGCQCEGHWTTRLVNYVVIQRKYTIVDGERRSSRYSEVKCYKCYCKWRSDARYVAKLPDGEERKYKRLTDADVLKLIRKGRIVVDPETGKVTKQRRHGVRWVDKQVVLQQSADRNGYLFVDLKNGGARKRCAVHRLVWMWVHNELIPRGYDLDHLDRRRDNSRIDNLRLRNLHENRSDQKHGKSDEDEEIPF